MMTISILGRIIVLIMSREFNKELKEQQDYNIREFMEDIKEQQDYKTREFMYCMKLGQLLH